MYYPVFGVRRKHILHQMGYKLITVHSNKFTSRYYRKKVKELKNILSFIAFTNLFNEHI